MTIPNSEPLAAASSPLVSNPPASAQPGPAQPVPAQPVPARPVSAQAASEQLGARRFALHFGVVLLASVAVATLVGGQRAGLSAGLGVAMAGANLLLMQKITRAMMGNSSAAGNAAWGLALPFKLVALVGVAYALVSGGVAQPVPLAMGFALLPLTGVFLPRPASVRAARPARPL